MSEIVTHHTTPICLYKVLIFHHIISHGIIRITYRTITVHQMRKSFNNIDKPSVIFTYSEDIIPSSRHTVEPTVHIWSDTFETAAYKFLDPFRVTYSPEFIEPFNVTFRITAAYNGRHQKPK